MRILVLGLLPLVLSCQTAMKKSVPNPEALIGTAEVFIQHGIRSGEAYFSQAGERVVFQSEVAGENPFYQIYMQDLQTKAITRISPGVGKSTCAWLLPDGAGILFSSTHEDPGATKDAAEEIQRRQQPQRRGYSWDYDPEYELYLTKDQGSTYSKLAPAKGYDAEGSASPDGKWIVFASNRHAYSSRLNAADTQKLADDPSYFLDLYLVSIDGKTLRRLTRTLGYDGGPFFSPDGQSIVFRRFSADGRTAEIHTISVDGKTEKQITRTGKMSWAPFFHPSGEYIVFTAPVSDHRNFELFIVDADGNSDPVQVTEMPGFDGLPVFTPDGQYLTWNRPTPEGQTQIYRAKWNHELALKKLGLNSRFPSSNSLDPLINVDDLQKFVKYLSSEEMQGRMTGSAEEIRYTNAIAEYFKKIGLQPYRGSYIHEFAFPKSSQLLGQNHLILLSETQRPLRLGKEWVPSNSSKAGQVAAAPLIFAGYGISAPDSGVNAYEQADVEKKWVVVLEGLPADLPKKEKLALLPYASEQFKTATAAQKKARGIVFVKKDVTEFHFNTLPAEVSDLPVLYITQSAFEEILKVDKLRHSQLSSEYDKDLNKTATELKSKFSAAINITREKSTGRNVIGQLAGNTQKKIVLGAHGDHLGKGENTGSLRTSKDKSDIHYGADDNASGMAAVLEAAHQLRTQYKSKAPRSTVLFAIWSGEELGNLGSLAFIDKEKKRVSQFEAYINLDMVGRLVNEGQVRPLNVLGLGSSAELQNVVDATKGDLAIQTGEDPYLPTDAMSFYLAKIPIIALFTGSHSDYHTPRDRIEKIDFLGLKSVTEFSVRLVDKLAQSSNQIRYQTYERKGGSTRFRFSIYLGTIPDYNYQGKGVRLSGVVAASPAEQAGLQEGDIIVSYDGEPVAGMQDYMKSLQLSEAEKIYPVQIQRGEKFLTLNVSPAHKEQKQ